MPAQMNTTNQPPPPLQPLQPNTDPPTLISSRGPTTAHTVLITAAVMAKKTSHMPQPSSLTPMRHPSSFSDTSDLSSMSDASSSDAAPSDEDADDRPDVTNPDISPTTTSTLTKPARSSAKTAWSPNTLSAQLASASPSVRGGRGAGKARRGSGRSRRARSRTNGFLGRRKAESSKGTAASGVEAEQDVMGQIEKATLGPNVYGADPGGVYCVCRAGYDGIEFMVGCDGCQEWFHGRCIRRIPEDISDHYYFCDDCSLKSNAKGPWQHATGTLAPSLNGLHSVNGNVVTHMDAGKRKRGGGAGRGRASERIETDSSDEAEKYIYCGHDNIMNVPRNAKTGGPPASSSPKHRASANKISRLSGLGSATLDVDEDDEEEDDLGDICPVCESECTCGTAAAAVAAAAASLVDGEEYGTTAAQTNLPSSATAPHHHHHRRLGKTGGKRDGVEKKSAQRSTVMQGGRSLLSGPESTGSGSSSRSGSDSDSMQGDESNDDESFGGMAQRKGFEAASPENGFGFGFDVGINGARASPSSAVTTTVVTRVDSSYMDDDAASRLDGGGDVRMAIIEALKIHNTAMGLSGGAFSVVKMEPRSEVEEDDEMIDPEALDALVDDLSSLSSRAVESEAGDAEGVQEVVNAGDEEGGELGDGDDVIDEESSSTSADSTTEDEEIDSGDDEDLEDDEERHLVEQMKAEEREEAIRRGLGMGGHNRRFGFDGEEEEEEEMEEIPMGSWSSTEDDDEEQEEEDEAGSGDEGEEGMFYDELRDAEFSAFQDMPEIAIGNGKALAELVFTQQQLQDALVEAGVDLSVLGGLASLAAVVEQEREGARSGEMGKSEENVVTELNAPVSAAFAREFVDSAAILPPLPTTVTTSPPLLPTPQTTSATSTLVSTPIATISAMPTSTSSPFKKVVSFPTNLTASTTTTTITTSAGPTTYVTTRSMPPPNTAAFKTPPAVAAAPGGNRQILPRLTTAGIIPTSAITALPPPVVSTPPAKPKRASVPRLSSGALKEATLNAAARKKDGATTPAAVIEEKEKANAEAVAVAEAAVTAAVVGTTTGTGRKRKGDETSGTPKRRRASTSKTSSIAMTTTIGTMPSPLSPLAVNTIPNPAPSAEPEPDPIPIDEVVDTEQLYVRSSSRSPSPELPPSPGSQRFLKDIYRWDKIPIGSYRQSRRPSAQHILYTTSTALKDNSNEQGGSTLLCDVKKVQPTGSLLRSSTNATQHPRGFASRKRPPMLQESCSLSPVLSHVSTPSSAKSRLANHTNSRNAAHPAPLTSAITAAGAEIEESDLSFFISPQGVVADIMDVSQPPSSACSSPLDSPLFGANRHGGIVLPDLSLDEEGVHAGAIARTNGGRATGPAGFRPSSAAGLLGIRGRR
ncbi:hypothetical protein BC938DRAFT_480951 [Jimgerdemannia flammicorona]|uniref:PHD-type domain-containing protein n=1 Tax=Jimgerdemannia flammicorona TaxID=994334 RepID=A0A433QHA7_9FUNG|nr:hypothetical protein BC938DRAFT_480951 [Jimgerdemannia flammicorona]